MVVVVGCESEGVGGYLFDESAVFVVVLAFIGVAKHFPGLHDGVELVLAGFAVGVLVRVVLQHQTSVLRLEFTLGGTVGDFEYCVVVDFWVDAKLCEFDVDDALVLQCSQQE
jgi:hypothetical protein